MTGHEDFFVRNPVTIVHEVRMRGSYPSPWIRTFGAWSPVPRPADDEAIVVGYLEAGRRLAEELADAGAEALGPIDFRVSEAHYFADPELDGPPLALLAEVRAIVLRHPNPFPKMTLLRWPWSRR